MRVVTLALALIAVSGVTSASLPDNARRSLHGNLVDHTTSQLESRSKESAAEAITNFAKLETPNVDALTDTLATANKQHTPDLEDQLLLKTQTKTLSPQPSFKESDVTREKNLGRLPSVKHYDDIDKTGEDGIKNKILEQLAKDKSKTGKEVQYIRKPSKLDKAVDALAYISIGSILGASGMLIANGARQQKEINRCMKTPKDQLSGRCLDYVLNLPTPAAEKRRKELGFSQAAAPAPRKT